MYAAAPKARGMQIRRFLAKRYRASGLNDVMKAIGGLVDAGASDPHVIKLARQITSGAFDLYTDPVTHQQIPVIMAWGRPYHASTAPACFTRDDNCEIQAIWDFVVMNTRYVADPPHVDTYPDVQFILEGHGEDCDGFTILFDSLCKAIGFNVGARVISQDGREWAHIYPMIAMPKGSVQGYLPLDATEPGRAPGWEYSSPMAVQDYQL